MEQVTQRIDNLYIADRSSGQSQTQTGLLPQKLNVMTINMNGTGNAEKHRAEVNEAIAISNQKDSPCPPDIIFAQEIGAPKQDKWKLEATGYSEAGVTNKEAGIMWREKTFKTCPPLIDNKFKENLPCVFPPKDEEKVQPSKEYKAIISERLCAVVLKHKAYNYTILAVSWHGPHTEAIDAADQYKGVEIADPTKHLKHQVFKHFQTYVKAMYENVFESTTNNFVVIGGDFNLDFEDPELQYEEGFSCKKYTMSCRRRVKQKELIDNFLIYPSGKMEIEGIIPYDFRQKITPCTVILQQQSDETTEDIRVQVHSSVKHIINANQNQCSWFFISEVRNTARIAVRNLKQIVDQPERTTAESEIDVNGIKVKVNCYSGQWSWVLVERESEQWSWTLVNQALVNRDKKQKKFDNYCVRHKKDTDQQNAQNSLVIIGQGYLRLHGYFIVHYTTNGLPLTNIFFSTIRETYKLDHDPVLARITFELESSCDTDERRDCEAN